MMDALRFIFSSFWIWLGFTTLVAVVLKYLVDEIKAIRNTRNVKIYTFENGNRTVEIENATKADVADAIGTSSGQFE
ncbi:MAG: hypothetical protein ACLVHA_11545 [Faecalibacterium prausnitzii]